MQNLLNTYNEKLDTLEAEHKKAREREREDRQNNDQNKTVLESSSRSFGSSNGIMPTSYI